MIPTDVVILSEAKDLLVMNINKKIREFRPTVRQLAALKRAERNVRKGKALPNDGVS